MSFSLDVGLVLAVSALLGQEAQRDDVATLLGAGKTRQAARALARLDHVDTKTLGTLAQSSALAVFASAFADAEPKSETIARIVRGLAAGAAHDPKTCVAELSPLLDDTRYGTFVVHHVGRRSLQTCRRGEVVGVAALEQIRDLYPTAAWSRANLALGLRLVGRYGAARRIYDKLVQETPRAAWVRNELGLLQLACGDRGGALATFLQGSSQSAADPASRDTCAGNAAMVLLSRNTPGEREKAAGLLREVVERDPSRVRSAYWFRQLARPGARLPSGLSKESAGNR